MDNEYSVKLSVKLDDKSVTGVKKEIEEKFSDTEIKVKIDPDELGKASKEIQAISTELKQITEQAKGLKQVSTEASKIAESLKGTSDVAAAVADDIERFKRNAPKKEDAVGIQAVADGVKEVSAAFSSAEEVASALGVELDNFKVKSTSVDTANKEITTYTNNLKDVLTITKQTSDGIDMYSGKLKVLGDGAREAAEGTEILEKETQKAKESVVTLGNALSSVGLNEKQLETEFKLISTSVDNLGNSVQKYANGAGQVVTVTQKGSGEMATYAAKINTTHSELKKAQVAEDEFGLAIRKTTGYIRDQSFASGDWMYNWTKAMQSYLTYMTVQKLSQNIGRAIKDMIEEVKDLDKALVELQKVTTLSGRELDAFVDAAYAAGETVAKTGTEMVEAATSFAKAGYKDTALQLGTVAAMYTNIADEAISAADAADMIVAQMKAFNIEAENTTHIIDAINEVSNNFAVSSADIAKNLGKSSAVMANAGNSFEQMIGLMTAGTEITRNASKVANGLKTITLRLQGMNDEGEKDLQLTAQMEALFNKLGISVYKTSGELKNTYEILETLAEVYTNLSNAEKAYVTETIAGKYQAQNAAAILMNWKTAVDATSTALNSNGSAAAENAKVLDSIQGHIQKLNSAWENFSRQVIDSDLIKGVVDLGTAFLKFANTGVGVTLTRTVALSAAFSALFVVFSKVKKIWKEGQRILETLKKTEVGFLDAIKNISRLRELQAIREQLLNDKNKEALITENLRNKLLQQYGITLKSTATKEEALIAVNDGLKASYVGLSLGIGAASLALSLLIGFINDRKQARESALQDALEEISNLNSELKEVDDTIASIKKLRKTLDDNSSSYEEATAAREELVKIQEELKKRYGEEVSSIDLVTGSIDEQIKKLKELQVEQSKTYVRENRAAYSDAKDYVSGEKNWHDEINSISYPYIYDNVYIDDKIKEMVSKYSGELLQGQDTQRLQFHSRDSRLKFFQEFSDYLQDNETDLIKSGKLTQKEWDETLSYVQDKLKSVEKDVAEYQELIKGYNEELLKSVGFEFFKDDLSTLSQTTTLTEENVQALIDKYPGLAEAMELNGKSAKDLIKDYQNINIVIKDNVKDINKSIDTFNKKQLRRSDILKMPNNKDATEEEIEAYNRLKDIADDAGISIEALVNILVQKNAIMADAKSYDEEMANITNQWAESVKSFVKDLESLDNAYKTTSAAQKEYNEYGYFSIETLEKLMQLDFQYIDALVDENGKIKNNVNWYQKQLEIYIDSEKLKVTQIYYNKLLTISENAQSLAMANEADAANILKSAYGNLGESTKDLTARIKVLKDTLNSEYGDNTNIQKAMKDAEKEYNKYMAILNAGWKGAKKYGTSGYAGSKSSKSNSSENQKEWWETAYDDLKNQYDNSEITINNYIDGLEKLLAKLGKGTEGWNKIHKELQKQKLDKIKDDYNAGRISLDQYIISLQNLQKEYKEGTKEWNNLASAIKKANLEKLKNNQNDLKSALEAVNSTLDKQIENYEKLKDEADKAYDAELDGLNDTKDALEDKDNEYQSAQKAVIKYLKEQLDALQKQKDGVDTYYDDVIDSLDKMNDEEEKALELAEAYEALMNAMTQKTKKVWREGLGWVWEADQEAIAEAKKTYDDLIHSSTIEDIEKQKEAAGKSLEEQIEALNDYIDSWEDVLDRFGNDKDNSLATKLLGENWQELASQLDPEVVQEFSDAYYQLQQSIEETDSRIEELTKLKEEQDKYWDDLINNVKDYKEKWGEVSEDYEDAQNKIIANQILMAGWEKDILDQRISVLENFKNKYNNILDAINLVNGMSDDTASGYTVPELQGYSKGGEVDYTGLAMLHGTPSKPEYVLNNDQIRNLLSNITKPQVTSAFAGSSVGAVNNYNFGNIELPNVNNAQQFISELKSLVNTTRNL